MFSKNTFFGAKKHFLIFYIFFILFGRLTLQLIRNVKMEGHCASWPALLNGVVSTSVHVSKCQRHKISTNNFFKSYKPALLLHLRHIHSLVLALSHTPSLSLSRSLSLSHLLPHFYLRFFSFCTILFLPLLPFQTLSFLFSFHVDVYVYVHCV